MMQAMEDGTVPASTTLFPWSCSPWLGVPRSRPAPNRGPCTPGLGFEVSGFGVQDLGLLGFRGFWPAADFNNVGSMPEWVSDSGSLRHCCLCPDGE